jgi:hypothetical protein
MENCTLDMMTAEKYNYFGSIQEKTKNLISNMSSLQRSKKSNFGKFFFLLSLKSKTKIKLES